MSPQVHTYAKERTWERKRLLVGFLRHLNVSREKRMFWGLTLEAGKHYSQSIEDSFHVSMAALELQDDYKDRSPRPPVQVMVQHHKKDFLLCSLIHGTLIQQPLDLEFTEGEQVTFYLEGSGAVHLTGFLVQEKPFDSEEEPILGSPPESSEDGMEVSDEEGDAKEDLDETIPSLQQLASGQDLESEDDESEEEWTPVQKAESTKKRKSTEKTPTTQKKKKSDAKVKEEEEDESSEDEEDGDEEDIVDEMADLIKDIEENGNGGKEETDESGKVKQEAEEKTSPKKKKNKKKKQQEQQEQQGNKTEGSKPPTTPKAANKNKDKPAQTPAKSKKKLSNGVVIEDTVVGEGKLARPLKMVGVYYKGTLAGRKQEFDSCLSGKPFRFRLGTKEVISGWDSGLSGMRVGGKRRLTIPPSQGYGKARAGSIPPNSTLVFDVELKEVR